MNKSENDSQYLEKYQRNLYRSSPPEVFLGKGVQKIYSKFTEKHPCRSVISIKLHGCTSEEVLKNHLGRCKLQGHKESSSQKLITRRCVTKSSSQKQNTNYIYLLQSTRILKAFYVNKARLSHRYRNPSPPNTSITYHVRAASMRNAVMDNASNHPK